MRLKLVFAKLSLIFIVMVMLMQSLPLSVLWKNSDNKSKVPNVIKPEEHIPFRGIKYIDTSYDYPKMTEPFKMIDVSAWQEEIDWKAVAQSGVKGVILRLARYNLDKDEYFDINYRGAKENGLMVGCYFFMGATTIDEAEAEAKKVADILDENKYVLELPVFYDVEDEHDTVPGNISSLDRQLLTDIIKTFCGKMQEYGYYSGYYSNLIFANRHYYHEQLYMYPYWVARWNDYNSNPIPYTVWQYSATGTVPGVEGDCDLDLCFADFYGFMKERGFNNLNLGDD